MDAFDKIYAHAGAAPSRSGDWLDWGLLHGRRRIEPLITAITGEPTQAADPWLTPWRTKKAAQYRDAVRWLRRTTGGASVVAAARRAHVDRGTLAKWIKDGKLERPEAVPDR